MSTIDTPAPPSLFKYFPRDRIASFGKCLLRFSPLSAFNDPFEGRPDITSFFAESELRIRLQQVYPDTLRRTYAGLSPEQQAQIPEDVFVEFGLKLFEQSLPDTLAEYSPIITSVARTFPDHLDGAVGALCLCKNRDSLLMWAHYASSHMGFLVEYATGSEYFDARRSVDDEFYYLREVEYRDERPSAELMDLDSAELWFVKSRHWEYECEWRILKPLADADSIIDVNGLPIHLFRHSADLVRAVIMGARSCDADVELMRSTLRIEAGFSHVRLFKARAHDSLFQLEFDEIGF